ncbi:hypothetical protein SAPIO_CDS10327 [Scedosporium apiospermum]|uniref:Uncharacterized protein n=1 Tax=Pseudallescheria apiosperma TaxID=563466 RepID=A0A084FV63_PSEDA|nr:uncharacterized protein SAPIO_CDS10327 [Scedosporium apiospermum]KEZ38975.1 hypothetical protein SAPIO_CDS10327 [Scedosporium apiospermum]
MQQLQRASSAGGSSSSGDANAANGNDEGGGSSKAGVIAGAVVGSVSGIGLLAGAFFPYRFLKNRPKPEIPPNPVVEDGPTGRSELGGLGKTAEQIGKPEIDGQEKSAVESSAVFGTGTPATVELGSPGLSPLPHAQELSAQPTAAELASSTGAYHSGSIGELPASMVVYEMPAEPYTGSNHDPRVIRT